MRTQWWPSHLVYGEVLKLGDEGVVFRWRKGVVPARSLGGVWMVVSDYLQMMCERANAVMLGLYPW